MTAKHINKTKPVDYTEKISAGLVLWLKDVRGVDAVSAALNESEVERSYYEGCDTCGYGAEDDKITTTITYERTGVKGWERYGSVEIDGTSVNFLPELLSYIDRASENRG